MAVGETKIVKFNHNEVIKELTDQLCSYYIFPEKAKETAEYLNQKLVNGEYNAFETGEVFSKVLTDDLYKMTKDLHLGVYYSIEEKWVDKEVSKKERWEESVRRGRVNNYGFHKLERLSGNIGYLDLRNFYDLSLGAETAAQAMNFLANTEAFIFDLRKNNGGSPEMVAFIISYLLDEVTHLNSFYYRPKDSTRQFWSHGFVPGKRSTDKPVYVLTSSRTFSAAEEFTYNLKNLKRATIIGEVTGGGAHPGAFHQLTKNFKVFIPNGRAINPITNTNWEGTGVEPDIYSEKEQAFNIAYQEALLYVKNKYDDQKEYRFLLEEVNQALQKELG